MKYCQVCELTDTDNQDLYCEKCGGLLVERPIYEDPVYFSRSKQNWFYISISLFKKILILITLIITTGISFILYYYYKMVFIAFIFFSIILLLIGILLAIYSGQFEKDRYYRKYE